MSDVKKLEAFPLTKNLILLPLKLTFPSKSTDNKGVFLNTSVASSEL